MYAVQEAILNEVKRIGELLQKPLLTFIAATTALRLVFSSFQTLKRRYFSLIKKKTKLLLGKKPTQV